MESARDRLDALKLAPGAAGAPCVARRTDVPLTLAEGLGGEELALDGCRCWRIEVPFAQSCPATSLAPAAFAAPLTLPGGAGPVQLDPAATIVLDIETGGFAGTPIFLIGVVLLRRWPLTSIQWLARDYPEEEAVLRSVAPLLAECPTWVTFNGRSFDAPFLNDRATLHRIALPAPAVHFDLLHAARRAWRAALPNCRLGTLEAHILGRRRVGDVPGADVPDLFHHFVRTGQAGPLRPVLAHNRLDLVSATELLVRLAALPVAGD
jgi:uncharacterized protein YprB with RNaseH-like and TPR domain